MSSCITGQTLVVNIEGIQIEWLLKGAAPIRRTIRKRLRIRSLWCREPKEARIESLNTTFNNSDREQHAPAEI